MRKYLISAAVLLAALTGCKNTPKPTETAVKTDSTEMTSHAVTGKIAVYYVDKVLASYDMAKEHQTSFEDEYNKTDKELQASARSLEKDYNALQDKVNKVLITRADAEKEAARLQQRQQSLAARSDKARQDLAEKNQVMTNQIYTSIADYVKQLNADFTYDMIIATSEVTGPVISVNSSLDITQEIIDGLNKQYAADKSASKPDKADSAK